MVFAAVVLKRKRGKDEVAVYPISVSGISGDDTVMKKTLKASYTVEAAILMPIVLCVVAVCFKKVSLCISKRRRNFKTRTAYAGQRRIKIHLPFGDGEDIWEEFGWK